MKYLFSTGLPRSGTTLFTKSMSTNDEIMMAMGPNIEIYRFFRDALVKKYGTSNLKKIVKSGSPIQDYFGSKYKIELLNLMLNSDLNEKFDMKLWKSFLQKSISRVDHDSIDLIKFFSQLKGNTYKEIIINLLNIIMKQRKSNRRKYNGFNESWNICSLKTLAQTFPNSKFIIILRDPRAVWTSLNKNATKRKDLKVQLLSLSRHFRKYVILSNYYLSLPIFKKKLLIYRFEDFIKNPKKILIKICKFLEVKFDNKMLNVNNFFDFNTNRKWKPNSAFDINLKKIDKKVIYNWKNKINKLDLKTIEFLCNSDLKSAKYKSIYNEKDINLNEILSNIKENYNSQVKWRTDLNNFKKDKELEILRYKILKNKSKFEQKSVEKCFLFKDYKNKFLKNYFQSRI